MADFVLLEEMAVLELPSTIVTLNELLKELARAQQHTAQQRQATASPNTQETL